MWQIWTGLERIEAHQLRIRWRRLLTHLSWVGASAILAACASTGPTSNPLSRSASWFDYLAGNDIRATCGPGSRERYRAVYNADYRQQVRTYDIDQPRAGETSVLFSRVFRGTIFLLQGADAGGGFAGERVRTFLSGEQTGTIKQALADTGAFDPSHERLFLRSDTFYWTVATCANGRFNFRAYKAPPDDLNRLEFARALFRVDETGTPVRRPRMTPADRRTNFGRITEPDSPGGDVVFELEAGPGGLR